MIIKRYAVYHSQAIYAWEKRWFAGQNSSYGLMQQAALQMLQQIEFILQQRQMIEPKIAVWCGTGNNAGDGYLIACYLKQSGYNVCVIATDIAKTIDAKRAEQQAKQQGIVIQKQYEHIVAQVHIDALFGHGLNRNLDQQQQHIIQQLNQCSGLKIAVDIPSGLHPNTGIALPIAVKADITLCVMALKLGVLIGQAQDYVGELIELPLIPADDELKASAYIDYRYPVLPERYASQHKGSFGHVLVIGGHANMGGAVIMSGEAAMSSGAGKVTIMCDVQHHSAIVSRSPNIMLQDIDKIEYAELTVFLQQIDTICFGMGLGRDQWAKNKFDLIMEILQQQDMSTVVLDADALWFLAQTSSIKLHNNWIATPHSGEAARLLGVSVVEIDQDKVTAIQQLQQKYGGQWLLKGAGSLTLVDDHLEICAFGNAGMATAGMGDVLSGMIAGLKAQFQHNISLANIVALHALAGDKLAQQGMQGVQAHHMSEAIYQVINHH